MALMGNGRLLARVRSAPLAEALDSGTEPFKVAGYTSEPLSPATRGHEAFADIAGTVEWLIFEPEVAGPQPDLDNPWDSAHAAAAANGYRHYVEPDLLHDRPAVPRGTRNGGLNPHWPPKVPDGIGVPPLWHLGSAYAGFGAVRETATGRGIRIAHLDTGYTAWHLSKPRHLRPDLGTDYWAHEPHWIDPVDPHSAGFEDNPGHGTATLALLAGAEMELNFGNFSSRDAVGGAPDAEVVPVRISPSVIHLATSTMAQGLLHALAPNGDRRQCDVISISHGGLPSTAWADAVNRVYEAGIVIVAASGDSINGVIVDLVTRFTIYPSAFNRVITVLGATYLKQPFITEEPGVLQECWGPDTVMEKAITAFTPNIPWMRSDDQREPAAFDMDGNGTSAATPQVAAACALWLQMYGHRVPAGWQRVEACRLALFAGAEKDGTDLSRYGQGLLNVARTLEREIADNAIAEALAGQPAQKDEVSPLVVPRLLAGLGTPGSEENRMYVTEVAQVIRQSRDGKLLALFRLAEDGGPLGPADTVEMVRMLMAEGVSRALKARLDLLLP